MVLPHEFPYLCCGMPMELSPRVPPDNEVYPTWGREITPTIGGDGISFITPWMFDVICMNCGTVHTKLFDLRVIGYVEVTRKKEETIDQ